ncbi:MAG TPA: hypothetical protein PKW30_06250, partial [Campylobacterales bacterium]|nr:hypothetical protein [Campylobacterales bacterium]
MSKDFFEFYKQAYNREIERKQEIEGNASTTVTTLGFLFTFIAFYLLNWADGSLIEKHGCLYNIFALLVSAGVILMCIGIYKIARFFLTAQIKVLDTPV